jgi:hypothetical protein
MGLEQVSDGNEVFRSHIYKDTMPGRPARDNQGSRIALPWRLLRHFLPPRESHSQIAELALAKSVGLPIAQRSWSWKLVALYLFP